jgi:excisionase family DNA binding protein
MNGTERYLTVGEAAAFLNTSERFVRRLISERRVTFHYVGRHVRFAVSDLEAFVLAGGGRTGDAAQRPAIALRGCVMPGKRKRRFARCASCRRDAGRRATGARTG